MPADSHTIEILVDEVRGMRGDVRDIGGRLDAQGETITGIRIDVARLQVKGGVGTKLMLAAAAAIPTIGVVILWLAKGA